MLGISLAINSIKSATAASEAPLKVSLEGNSVEIEGMRYTIGRNYSEEVKGKILN